MTAQRLFNTPLECSFRMLFLLQAVSPGVADLQRLISYDYLTVHSGDVDGGPESLHPAVPFRGSEWLVKRDLVRSALQLAFARQLIDKRLSATGVVYAGTALTAAFTALLKSPYAAHMAARARWVAGRFGDMSDAKLKDFMTENVGSWGAEFYRLPALRGLEL